MRIFASILTLLVLALPSYSQQQQLPQIGETVTGPGGALYRVRSVDGETWLIPITSAQQTAFAPPQVQPQPAPRAADPIPVPVPAPQAPPVYNYYYTGPMHSGPVQYIYPVSNGNQMYQSRPTAPAPVQPRTSFEIPGPVYQEPTYTVPYYSTPVYYPTAPAPTYYYSTPVSYSTSYYTAVPTTYYSAGVATRPYPGRPRLNRAYNAGIRGGAGIGFVGSYNGGYSGGFSGGISCAGGA